ncbi:MAG TPA: glycoside hydrolase family 2 TIM barrel-domain containing protein [Candidatus Omnitrophota bacterium]|nr:glycoside hydrolase family 2 TIM barrel-domain containing protein [Candidatus Omnitrophota bacterium]
MKRVLSFHSSNPDIRKMNMVFLVLGFVCFGLSGVFAQTDDTLRNATAVEQKTASGVAIQPTSGELINKAWDANGKKNFDAVFESTRKLIDLYSADADKQQASVKKLSKARAEIESVQLLNDVATAYFIQGEAYRSQGKNDEAIRVFKIVVEKYCFAQAWDPRGWFWSVAKAARESILKLNPSEQLVSPCPEEKEKVKIKVSNTPTKVVLYDSGKEDVVNYEKYGEFLNAGTREYRYAVKDQEGLSAAVGEGVYPNTTSIRWDPEYKKALKEKRLDGDQWDFLQSPDFEAAFLKWATASEPQGVRLFYTGLVLEKAGLIKQAIKCYYAIAVHFPGAYGWTYWHTPWYVGQAAVGKIHYLLRKDPSLGYKLVDANIAIENGFDNDVSNDVVVANPGRFVKIGPLENLKAKPNRDLISIKKRSGKGKVYVQQYDTGDWELIVDGKPYTIQGITYAPTKIGQSPDFGTQTSWMEDDFNANGKVDGPYDSFVDKNKNNVQDKDEPVVGDFKLMQEMGVNTIRQYHHPLKVDKVVLRDMYEKYGIRVILGDFLGKYAIGSGANWNPGTDYTNEEQKKKMMESVLGMVREHKDEPYILFWLLGNENVYGYGCNADKEPDAYFTFANEVAKKIKEIDPDHPVAICSGDIMFLDKFGKDCPDIDIFGTNAYRGEYGFGFFWKQVKDYADKPAFITEFGCPAKAEGKAEDEAEELQAQYHLGSWEDIANNMAFAGGAGNAIGGVVFEWVDEWWKAYEPSVHDVKALWAGPFPDGYMHEEWLGVTSQGDGKNSPFLRQLRKSYFTYKKLWK